MGKYRAPHFSIRGSIEQLLVKKESYCVMQQERGGVFIKDARTRYGRAYRAIPMCQSREEAFTEHINITKLKQGAYGKLFPLGEKSA